MLPYTHGGDVLTAQARYGGPVLDCSANLTPLGMPPQVGEAAARAAAQASPYPDPLCRALRAAIAAHDGVAPEQVLCGGGADLPAGLRPETPPGPGHCPYLLRV